VSDLSFVFRDFPLKYLFLGIAALSGETFLAWAGGFEKCCFVHKSGELIKHFVLWANYQDYELTASNPDLDL
jgi:hypothetical protein